ncbi:hypothetical protein A3C37_03470 [Candidatus Peribacteria bacterium RIFCSPHIGHO2_02_FULL_53_20]|nr:MAG: hypothetical protein A3C37_03470 [Candidatus Peribacteria bacterium RIFCSPHIGHO2_02_FULL_53_20]OGJ72357.1 MAG: hypothetical protein A3G69_03790 [Candidatus Peribacteria bacterium RIFCSPLOWO2_12_FULL_53_10]
MFERTSAIHHIPHTHLCSGSIPSLRTAFAAMFLTLISTGSVHHPSDVPSQPTASGLRTTSLSGNATIFMQQAMKNQDQKAAALGTFEPKTDMLNRRFTVGDDARSVAISLDRDNDVFTLHIGSIDLRIVSVKDTNGCMYELTQETVKSNKSSCHVQRTHQGIHASVVIVPWVWEPGYEFTDEQIDTFKQQTLAALKNKHPHCPHITVKIPQGDACIEITLKPLRSSSEEVATTTGVEQH